MRAATGYALACAVVAMACAGGIAYVHGWWRPLLAGAAVMWAACARGGLDVIGEQAGADRG